MLFVVYLDAALRGVLAAAPPRCPADSTLPVDIIYVDDTDFVSTSSAWLAQLERLTATVLKQWNLHVNAEKTEHTKLTRQQDRVSEEWRMTKKLGSLIGDGEDITRRKQLATASYRAMYSLWKRRTLVREELRLRLYNAFVIPVLLYNSGTWAPTSVAEAQLDSFHRRQLRSLIGIRWPQTISNAALYKRCKAQPISNFVRLAIIMETLWPYTAHAWRMSCCGGYDYLLPGEGKSVERTAKNDSAYRAIPSPAESGAERTQDVLWSPLPSGDCTGQRGVGGPLQGRLQVQ